MSTFAEGFARGKADKAKKDQEKELRDLQVKAFKADLELKDKQKVHQERFESLFQPSNQPQPGIEGPPQTAGKPMSFVEALADPEGQISGLLSGNISPKDIGLAQERRQFGDFLKAIQGGGGLTTGFTPESMMLAGATRDPKALEAVKPVQKVVQTEDGARIHSLNPLTGKLIADLGPAKEEKLPVGDAGKIQSIQFASQQLNQALDLLSPSGNLDKSLVAQLSVPVKFGTAREIDQLISDAITTKVLIQSGVTAREDEVKKAKDTFIPSLLDLTKEGLAERKLGRLRQFMDGALDLTVLPPSLRKRIEAKKNKPSLDLGKKKDLSNLSDEELQAIIDGK